MKSTFPTWRNSRDWNSVLSRRTGWWVDSAGLRNALEGPALRSAAGPTNKLLRVLLLEDSESDAELIAIELERAGMKPVIERVDTAEAFTTALKSFEPDVVLSDHSTGPFDSRAALEILRAVRPTAAFIVVTGAMTGSQSVAAIRAGAEDFILKTYLHRLPASISEALAVRRPLQTLTERQVQVLRLVAEGHRTRDIAKRLSLSIKTVESHRGELMKRLRVRDVVSLVRYAVRIGLVPLTFYGASFTQES